MVTGRCDLKKLLPVKVAEKRNAMKQTPPQACNPHKKSEQLWMQLQRVFGKTRAADHVFTHLFLLALRFVVSHVHALIECILHVSIDVRMDVPGVAN